MAELMNRPYRNASRVADKKKLAAEHKEQMRKHFGPKIPDAVVVPPVIVKLVEESIAGVQPSNTEGSPTGPKTED